MMSCGTCRYRYLAANGASECRFTAPFVGLGGVRAWPVVVAHDYCHSYEERSEDDSTPPGWDKEVAALEPGEGVPDWCSPAVAGVFLRISENTVKRMVADGRLGGVKVGRLYKIPRSAVEAAMREMAESDVYEGQEDV
jgi:excisionase family DNA binding protein